VGPYRVRSKVRVSVKFISLIQQNQAVVPIFI